MWFMLSIRNNKDSNTKVFGYSNLSYIYIGFYLFFFGWIILFSVNPITSSISKYTKTKSSYSKDIDHLITFNRNGLG